MGKINDAWTKFVLGDGIVGARILAKDWARRILAAYEREIAARVAVHQQWRQNYQERLAAKDEMARISAQSAQAKFDEEMAEKDAEIARLKACKGKENNND